ncbi:MAG: hypothetical protein GX366_00290 [Epulopiscium sp.]|nr:hypothetical protein [Candidatus Epulonipiscium sp.]
MSNIIKGQRIRSQSIFEIPNTSGYPVPEEEKAFPIEDEEKNHEKEKKKIKKEVKKAKLQANNIVEEAKRQAEEILNQASIESEQAALQTLEIAKEEGYKQGYNEGQNGANQLIEEAKEVLKEAKEEKIRILKQTEPEIIEMIIGISNRIISEELNYNKDIIILLVNKAIKEISSDIQDSEISIKVPSEDYDYVIEKQDIITEAISNPENLKFFKDPNLEKGTCLVETPFGSLECNVNESLLEVEKQLRLICNKG